MTGGARVVFHHDLARVVLVGWLALGTLLVSAAAPSDRPAQALGVAGVGCLLAAVGWCPALVLDDDGVTVRNPWRTVRLGWDQVAGVTQDWALTLTPRDGTPVRVWACPGPRRMRSLWEYDRTAGGVIARDALARLDAQGGSAVGLGDAGIVLLQRLEARAAPVSRPPDRPAGADGGAGQRLAAGTAVASRTSRALLATAVLLAAAAVLAS